MKMSVDKINDGLPTTTKIESLNNQTLELDGKISESGFSINELDSIYSDLGLSRKFRILSGAGNSVETYTNWTHVKAETGYSIWSIPFTNYRHNTVNEMYYNDRKMTYKGSAGQILYTTFDKVYLYDGYTYTDNTTEASSEEGIAFSLMGTTSSYLYLGLSSTFNAIDLNLSGKGDNYSLKVEYYNGASWVQLVATTNALVDNTGNFKSNGRIEFTLPTNWGTVAVNSVTKYWVRISTTTTPVNTATALSIFPGGSVYSLLQLSTTNALNEQWSWCYFNNNVYVTIRNAGANYYEGSTYVTSSSSVTNKQNFFVYNNAYKVNYEQTSYMTGAAFAPSYGFKMYNTGSSIEIINWSASTPFKITNTTSAGVWLRVNGGLNDLVTGASTGTGGVPPTQIKKYLTIDVDGTNYKIPLYAN